MGDSWNSGQDVADKIIEMHKTAIKIALDRMIKDGTLTEYINKAIKESYLEKRD
ncbi:MAG: hypothetical protein IJH63_10525 [Methanobrevibacter sp.]|nr:hypothetical protein [Methanosphaera sp.]MBR0371135.1 hypothetical protein [Methanobrevibacter sp.]